MDGSILTSIKKLLNVAPSDSSFDDEITMHINSALGEVTQLGVGPVNGFSIEDDALLWSAFVGDDVNLLNMVPTLVYYHVRLAFDPPQFGPGISAVEKQIEKLTWRVNAHREATQWSAPVDPTPTDPVDEPDESPFPDWGDPVDDNDFDGVIDGVSYALLYENLKV